MQHRSMQRLCSGTVVVHRDGAVTCTTDTCRTDLGRGPWFSTHSSFVRCTETLDRSRRCPDCGFETPAIAQMSRLQYARFVGHPSTWRET